MSVRDQAVYAFYAGNPQRTLQLLGRLDPSQATLEQMLLLAVSYGAGGDEDQKLAHRYYEQIVSRWPNTPWERLARKAMQQSPQGLER